MPVVNRLLSMLTWTDGILALALALLLVAWVSPYRRVVPLRAYWWGFALGLLLSLVWWTLLVYGLHTLEREEAYVAVTASITLPATVLGAEAGIAGFIALSTPWKICSLALAIVSGLLALTTASWIIGARLAH